jgi:hypothetical protein
MVPEVYDIGEDGTVLGGDDEDEEEDWAGTAEVLAFGVLILGVGIKVGAAGGVGVAVALVEARMNSAVASPLVTVYQLNLNLGTVLGSPFRSW